MKVDEQDSLASEPSEQPKRPAQWCMVHTARDAVWGVLGAGVDGLGWSASGCVGPGWTALAAVLYGLVGTGRIRAEQLQVGMYGLCARARKRGGNAERPRLAGCLLGLAWLTGAPRRRTARGDSGKACSGYDRSGQGLSVRSARSGQV